MPPKSKKKQQMLKSLDAANEAKRRRVSIAEEDETVDGASVQLLSLSDDALDMEDEEVDPTFDLDASLHYDVDHIFDSFCEDWVLQLDRDDRVSLGLFLCFQLRKQLDIRATAVSRFSAFWLRSRRQFRAVWVPSTMTRLSLTARDKAGQILSS